MATILYDENGKVHGVYTKKSKAIQDNDNHLRGRGFLSGEVKEDQFSEIPL